MKYQKFILRADLRNNPDTLYVFGDNIIERGLGGQAKEMRGEPNAIGVSTKLWPEMSETAFYDYFSKAKPRIDAAFMKLFVHASRGGEIVWPEDGIGTGLADLANKAPRIWSLIESYRRALDKLTRS